MRNDYAPRSPGRRKKDQFLDLYNQITGDVHIPTLLKRVSAIVSSEMNAEKTTVYMIKQETQELHSVNTISNVENMIKIPIREDSLAGFCAIRRRSFIINDAYADLSYIDAHIRFDLSWDKKLNFRTKDVMCVPAVYKDEVQGVIQVINSLNKPFADHDFEPLNSLAKMIAYNIYYARMYDELRTMKKLEKEKAEFMRILIHELKAPISGVKTIFSSLSYLKENDPRRLDFQERIGLRIDKMLFMIDDILYLSKVKSGSILGEIKVLELTQNIPEIFESYKEQAVAKGLEFIAEITDQEMFIRIDNQALKLIISNLLSNAVKYTIKGSIKIVLQKVEQKAIIEIKDTGMGIPKKDQPKLFNDFFRASNAKESGINGTGVGLSGVKDLVERFYGEMDFNSKENEGSQFTIKIPLYKD